MVCESRPRGFPRPAALALGRPAGIAPHLVPLVDAVNELGAGGGPGEADGGGVGGLSLHVPWGHRGDCGDQGTTCSGSNSLRSPPLLGATPQEPKTPLAGRIPPQHIPVSLLLPPVPKTPYGTACHCGVSLPTPAGPHLPPCSVHSVTFMLYTPRPALLYAATSIS